MKEKYTLLEIADYRNKTIAVIKIDMALTINEIKFKGFDVADKKYNPDFINQIRIKRTEKD